MNEEITEARAVGTEPDLRVRRHGPDLHPDAPPPHAHPDPRGVAAVPVLAEGLELIGRYEGSGFKEAPFIARRADGQMLQLPAALYMLAEEIDGRRNLEQIAERLTPKLQRTVTGDDVGFLIDEKLLPLGVVQPPAGQTQQLERSDPLLALKFRTAIVPRWVVRALTGIFRPLFFPPVVVAMVGALAALDVWLFAVHGVAQPMRHVFEEPSLLLLGLGLIVLSAMFHEIGHATGCAYGGATPGKMGVGLYIVWPAFYTDVTDAYRLGRAGRLRTDLGGVYFNGVFALALAGAYFATGMEALLAVAVVLHLEILHQMLPFLRLDGYYIIADLTGVPDMFTRIKPILRSLLPWRRTDDRVKELKPWARAVVTVWVLTVVPLLLYVMAIVLVHMPRIFATAGESLRARWGETNTAFGDGRMLAATAGIFEMLLLALPLIGLPLIFGRLFKRLGTSAWRRTEGKPAVRMLAAAALVAIGAGVVSVWWPGEQYRPIQPWERGTLYDAVATLREPRADPVTRAPASVRGGTDAVDDPAPSAGSTTTTPAGSGSVSTTTSTPPSASPTPTAEPSATASTSPSPTDPPSASPSPSVTP